METTRAKYDQLIQDLRGELRPQREWCEGRGLFMVIGNFVVGVAGGTWLFSLLYGNRAGLALALVLGDHFPGLRPGDCFLQTRQGLLAISPLRLVGKPFLRPIGQ